MRKVVDIANIIGASVTANDISIAHRLPSRADKEKPIFVKFVRRIGKIDLLKNQKELAKKPNVQHVKVFEDLSAPGVKFFNPMKSDQRVEKVWTRKGVIYYQLKKNE